MASTTNVLHAVANDLNPAPIEADSSSVTSDWDEESVASSTQSLTDSIRAHVYENGRRYHLRSKDQYSLPSDEIEQDRLDLMHHMHLELLGGNLTITKLDEDPANVLDCGCGTGIWALEFGDQHPGSKVLGVDLAPIQPGWTAPNVYFELDDLEMDWTFPKNHFNFIRSKALAVSIKDWPRYVKQMYKHAAPGAYIELNEHCLDRYDCDDGTMDMEDNAYKRYLDVMKPALEKLGVNPNFRSEDYKKMLEDAGFVDVKVYAFKIPAGGWAKNRKMKQIGYIMAETVKTGAEAYGYRLMTGIAGLPHEEARKLIDNVVTACTEPKEHAYYMEWYLTARKPE